MKLKRNIKTEVSRGGWSVLLYILPFDGDDDDIHRFEDHRHSLNFVRYLFSQSKAHPENPKTRLNLVSEFADDGRPAGSTYNTDAQALLSDFLKRRFPERDGEKLFVDDGCYPLFAIRTSSGEALSNFMTAHGDQVFISHSHLEYLPMFGHTQNDVMKAARRFARSGPVGEFESSTEDVLVRRVEAAVHRVVRVALGSPEKTILAVTHRDQDDHNPEYHIHRLLHVQDPLVV